MKKIIVTLLCVILCSFCFAQRKYKSEFKENIILADVTGGLGSFNTKICGIDETMYNGVHQKTTISFDGTIYGVMVGGSYILEEGGSNKKVHVKSYTRKQNGKTVYVNSYNRRNPNSASSSLEIGGICELHAGYWIPVKTSSDIFKLKIYSAPITGIGFDDGYEENEVVAIPRLLYGVGVKFTYWICGLTFQATNKSVSFGFSLCVTDKRMW